jgi:PAS domain S-box-containing protein
MIVAPLMHGGKAIGVLKTYAPSPGAFKDLDSYVLQLLAGMVSAAMMHAREYRERVASEERYRLLFDKNVAGVFRSTIQGRLLDCNDALVESLGYDSREDLLGHPTWDLYQQRSDREQLLSMLEDSHAARNVRIMMKRKDGSSIRGVVNVAKISGDDGESQILGTLVEE